MRLLEFCLTEGTIGAPRRYRALDDLFVSFMDGLPQGWGAGLPGVVIRRGEEGTEVDVGSKESIAGDAVYVPSEMADLVWRAQQFDEIAFDEYLDESHRFLMAVTDSDYLAWYLFRSLNVLSRDDLFEISSADAWRLFLTAHGIGADIDASRPANYVDLVRACWRRARLSGGWISVLDLGVEVVFPNEGLNEYWQFGGELPVENPVVPRNIAAYCLRYGGAGLDVISWLLGSWLEAGVAPANIAEPVRIWRTSDGEFLQPEETGHNSVDSYADIPSDITATLARQVSADGLVTTATAIADLDAFDAIRLRGHLARAHRVVSEDIPLLECEVLHYSLHAG